MKILLLCHEYPPAGGGAGWVAHRVGTHLALAGHSVCFLTARHVLRPFPPPGLPYRLIEVGYPRKAAFGGSVRDWLDFMVTGTRAAVAFSAADLQDGAIAFLTLPAGIPAVVLRARQGVPFLISLHGGDVPGFFPPEYRRYHLGTAGIIRAIWRRAAGLISPSSGLRQLALQAGAGNVTVIPHGADLEFFRPPTVGPAPGPVTILSVGRFARQKNNAGLLRAAALAAQRVDQMFRLEFVGDGPERHSLRSLAARVGLADRVTFLPWQTRENLLARYHGAHIFALFSHEEPFGIVVLEAMGCGLPIVATRTSGPEELVLHGQNGFLVPPGDEQALAGALVTLLTDDALRTRMGACSRGRAAQFQWSAIAAQFADLLTQAASDKVLGVVPQRLPS